MALYHVVARTRYGVPVGEMTVQATDPGAAVEYAYRCGLSRNEGGVSADLVASQPDHSTTRAVLEAARHELTTLNGLIAIDQVGDLPEGSWRIDNNAVIARIDAVLPASPDIDGDDDIAAIIDAAWQIPPGAQERIRSRFMELLAADEPNHPWVVAASSQRAGEGRGTDGK